VLQEAYLRGVSAWNFDVSALKAEAGKDLESELSVIDESVGGSGEDLVLHKCAEVGVCISCPFLVHFEWLTKAVIDTL
jgi:hypothetical protein